MPHCVSSCSLGRPAIHTLKSRSRFILHRLLDSDPRHQHCYLFNPAIACHARRIKVRQTLPNPARAALILYELPAQFPRGFPLGEVMAYIRKQRGKWRAEVQRNGVRVSAVFDAKASATAWAAREETAILAVKHGALPRRTLAEAIDRYVRDVSSLKAGERFERLRLEALKRDYPKLAGKVMSNLTTQDLVDWRDARLAKVTKGSVQRDINLLSHVFTKARDEWGWMRDNPFRGMEAPGDNPPRDRLPTWSENRRLLRWLGYRTGEFPKTKQAEAAWAYLLALRTAMRAGEVLQLGPRTVQGSVATVKHKMQYRTGKPRKVPLSKHALRLLRGFPGFTIDSAGLDAAFRKARDSLLIESLHFHDARADALTRFARKVDVMTLARISGHKDLRLLLSTYYRETAEEIAGRLA